MSAFIIVNDSCGLCAKEYIDEQSKKLVDMPNDQRKSAKINKIIHGAYRASCKPVVIIPCNLGETKICSDHLYKMIDAIKEYEDTASEIA